MTSGDQEYWILWCTKVGGTLGNYSSLKVIRRESTLLITWFLLVFFQCGMEGDTKPVSF